MKGRVETLTRSIAAHGTRSPSEPGQQQVEIKWVPRPIPSCRYA